MYVIDNGEQKIFKDNIDNTDLSLIIYKNRVVLFINNKPEKEDKFNNKYLDNVQNYLSSIYWHYYNNLETYILISKFSDKIYNYCHNVKNI